MTDPNQTTPTWEAEMLRLHRRNAWRHGWSEFFVILAVVAVLLWGPG